MNRADYDRYLAAFNAKDYDGVADFYAEPMKMDFFGVSLRNRNDLNRFYGFLHSHVKEDVTVCNFAASSTLTAVDAVVRVEALRDLPQAVLDTNGARALHPMAAGQIFELRQFISYTTRGGKIVQTECAIIPAAETVAEVAA